MFQIFGSKSRNGGHPLLLEFDIQWRGTMNAEVKQEEQEVLPVLKSDPLADLVGDERKRSKTMSRKEMARELRKRRSLNLIDPEEAELLSELTQNRPKNRSDCISSPRPCVFVSCKYNLYLDVNPETGSIKLNFPEKEIFELEYTCALDVAEKGGITLEEVGEIMNLTRERIRQVETRGLEKVRTETEREPRRPPQPNR
jgi:DNA-directed RNA polymerase sigma subunit (sigma70/sigma32)